jgi:hypothetical protein
MILADELNRTFEVAPTYELAQQLRDLPEIALPHIANVELVR